jgi:hypothetical protein
MGTTIKQLKSQAKELLSTEEYSELKKKLKTLSSDDAISYVKKKLKKKSPSKKSPSKKSPSKKSPSKKSPSKNRLKKSSGEYSEFKEKLNNMRLKSAPAGSGIVDIARVLEIRGRSTMRKEDLIKILLEQDIDELKKAYYEIAPVEAPKPKKKSNTKKAKEESEEEEEEEEEESEEEEEEEEEEEIPEPPKPKKKSKGKKAKEESEEEDIPEPPKRKKKAKEESEEEDIPEPPKRKKKPKEESEEEDIPEHPKSEEEPEEVIPEPPKSEEEPEEVIPEPPKPKKKSKEKPSSKECGENSRSELLQKRLEELQKILKNKGIKHASGVKDKDNAVDLICQLSQNKNRTCSVEDGSGCMDNEVCDIHTKPGVCVDKKTAVNSKDISWFEYNGKQILGSVEAINSLREKLNVPKNKLPSNDYNKQLVNKAMMVSGKPKDYFKYFTTKQLLFFLEGYNVNVNDIQSEYEEIHYPTNKKGRHEMISILANLTGRNKQEFIRWSNAELQQRIEALGEEQNMEELGEEQNIEEKGLYELRELVSNMTGRPVSVYKDWSKRELEERLEAEDVENRYPILEEPSIEDEEIPKSKKKVKSKKIEVVEEGEGEEGIEKPSEEEELSEEEEEVPKSKSKKVKEESEEESEEEKSESVSEEEPDLEEGKDIEKVLKDVMSGKKENIEDLTQVQNAVLKCLGLLSV